MGLIRQVSTLTKDDRRQVCAVCGALVEQTNPRRRVLYHPSCGRFRWFLRAAERELARIDISEDRRADVRRALVGLANRVTLPQPRDAAGRFVDQEG